MLKDSVTPALDRLDRAILRELQTDGRISNVDLARRVNLSPPAAYRRVQRLEQAGFVRAYTAVVDREKAGFDLLCFIHVSIQLHQPEQVAKFRRLIQKMPEVLECHHITGEYDYLLKAALRNRKDLERFVVDRLTPMSGIARIHTSLVLSEVKATPALPLDEP